MNKNPSAAAALVVATLLAGGCAWQQHDRGDPAGAAPPSGSFIPASFPPSARAKATHVGGCEYEDTCGIELNDEGTENGQCYLRPSFIDKLVVIRQKGKGKPVQVSWYIPPALQKRYAFQKDDGITFKKSEQTEFDKPTRVSAAEYSWRDRMTDNTLVYGYKIQVTRDGTTKCIYDPVVINDW